MEVRCNIARHQRTIWCDACWRTRVHETPLNAEASASAAKPAETSADDAEDADAEASCSLADAVSKAVGEKLDETGGSASSLGNWKSCLGQEAGSTLNLKAA